MTCDHLAVYGNPPKYSILSISCDGEDSWISVGTPKVEHIWTGACCYSRKWSEGERNYYDRVKQSTFADMFCEKNMLDFDANRVFSYKYFGYPIESNAL